MRDGVEYAKRIKRLFNRMRRDQKKLDFGEPTDPTEQLIMSILSVNTTAEQGRKAFRKLRDSMVDFNEIRVSSYGEIAGMIKDTVPNSLERAKALVDTLNAVFRIEHGVDLGPLRSMGRRDARRYLEDLDGIDPYTVASVMLWSLSGHAIPVSDRLLEALRANDLVAPESGVAHVQSFLKRHVSAADAKQFCYLMEKFAASKGRADSAKRTPGSLGGGKKKSREKSATKPATKSSTVRRKKAHPRD